jgi:serine/threonine-protein kinase RsbW
MRRVLGDTLRGLGVEEESVYDILLAVTEACTSVLDHCRPDSDGAGCWRGEGRGYAVVTSLRGAGCQLEVTGPGGRRRSLTVARPGGRRRSLTVARACVDDVTLRRRPGRDTVVILRKHIRWSWDAPLRRLATASSLS